MHYSCGYFVARGWVVSFDVAHALQPNNRYQLGARNSSGKAPRAIVQLRLSPWMTRQAIRTGLSDGVDNGIVLTNSLEKIAGGLCANCMP